ncbi:HU family DNA-binding protein [Riemerella anatipestifer]|nr:HU family DNA-binding protein [Riemerella anatipestifer]
MNRKEFCKEVSEKTNSSPEEVEKIYLSIIDLMKEQIKSKNKLTITDFGSFRLLNRAERIGMNPREGKSIIIPKKKALKFKVSKNFLECLQ